MITSLTTDLIRVEPLDEVTSGVSGRCALNHDGNVMPRHPRGGPSVNVVALGLVGSGHVFDDEIDIVLAMPKCGGSKFCDKVGLIHSDILVRHAQRIVNSES